MRGFLAAWALVLALPCVAAAGCKQTPAPPAADGAVTAASASSAALTPEQAAEVLAHVGDRTITLGDFASALEHMDRFDRMRYQSVERRKELLREMIDVMLLADEARAKGYDKDPATEQEVRQVLRDALLKKTHQDLPTAADLPGPEVRAFFDAHKAEFHDPERRRAAAIVLTSKAAADAVLAALKADPTKWGDLVRSRSVDPQAKSNVPVDLAGELGFVTAPDDPRGSNPRVPDAVREAVFTIPAVGGIDPTAVAVGPKFYVVKLASRTDPHDRTFEEAEHSVRVRLAQEKTHEREEALVEDLRKKFPVKVDEGALAKVNVVLPAADAAPPPAP